MRSKENGGNAKEAGVGQCTELLTLGSGADTGGLGAVGIHQIQMGREETITNGTSEI